MLEEVLKNDKATQTLPNVKRKTMASKLSAKIQDRFGLSYKSSLVVSTILNLSMGVGWTVASILGGSSFLIAEASDSFGDGISYGLGLFAEHKSNKVKAIVTYVKAGITFGLSALALGFSITRFALGWAVNPILGIALSGTGLLINGTCAYLLGEKGHSHGHSHDEHTPSRELSAKEKGEKALRKANWIHTISDLATGGVGIFFSSLDLIGVPGADLAGGAIGATIGFYSGKDILKEARTLRKLSKEEKLEKSVTRDLNINKNISSQASIDKEFQCDLGNIKDNSSHSYLRDGGKKDKDLNKIVKVKTPQLEVMETRF